MNEQLRKWKMLGLEQRIELLLGALSYCEHPLSDQNRRLADQYIRLVRQRNELRTADEVAQIERDRGIA